MSVQIVPDSTVLNEAAHVLMQNLPPSKFVRVWAALQQGHGDYLAWREEAFGTATAEQLYEQVAEYQTKHAPSP